MRRESAPTTAMTGATGATGATGRGLIDLPNQAATGGPPARVANLPGCDS